MCARIRGRTRKPRRPVHREGHPGRVRSSWSRRSDTTATSRGCHRCGRRSATHTAPMRAPSRSRNGTPRYAWMPMTRTAGWSRRWRSRVPCTRTSGRPSSATTAQSDVWIGASRRSAATVPPSPCIARAHDERAWRTGATVVVHRSSPCGGSPMSARTSTSDRPAQPVPPSRWIVRVRDVRAARLPSVRAPASTSRRRPPRRPRPSSATGWSRHRPTAVPCRCTAGGTRGRTGR